MCRRIQKPIHIDSIVNTLATRIDHSKKKVFAKDLQNETEVVFDYDSLVITNYSY
jgi:hypothetical protein